MDKGEKIKNGLRNIGWLVAFPVPVTKALAKKKGGKLGKKAATIAATWAMYVGLATAGVSAQINRPVREPVDTVAEVIDEEPLPAENPGNADTGNETVENPGERIEPRLVEFFDYVTYNYDRLLGVGEQTHFMAHVIPNNAYDTSITWYSSDESVAIVNEYGLVTAVGEGEAAIVARAVNGIESFGRVTVKDSATMQLRISVTVDGEEIDTDTDEWFVDWAVNGYDDTFVEERSQLSDESNGDTIRVVLGRKLEFRYNLDELYTNIYDYGWATQEITERIMKDGCAVVMNLHLEKVSYRTYAVDPEPKDAVVTFTLIPIE